MKEVVIKDFYLGARADKIDTCLNSMIDLIYVLCAAFLH
jgi:hypothetical protein